VSEVTRLGVYLIHGRGNWANLIHGRGNWAIRIANRVVMGFFALGTINFPPFITVLEGVTTVQAQETA